MQIKLSKSKFNLNVALSLVFLGVLLGLGYLGYAYLYGSVVGDDVVVPEGRIVRVQLKSFQDTIEYIQGLYDYEPEPLSLPRNNPFQ